MSDTDAQTVAFARETMIPAAPPPASQRGAIRWLREGVLSGPLNIVLTLISLWVIWLVLRDFVPWAWRGIWAAGSLDECRAIRDSRYGDGASVACWAVITDRWRQLTFGFYPVAELWRPPLALVLALLAVLPVLFAGLPRRLLWLSAAAPFVIYWLLFGGTIWGPLLTALGLGLAGLAAVAVGRQRGTGWGALAALAVLLAAFLDPFGLVVAGAGWLDGIVPLVPALAASLSALAPGSAAVWAPLLVAAGLALVGFLAAGLWRAGSPVAAAVVGAVLAAVLFLDLFAWIAWGLDAARLDGLFPLVPPVSDWLSGLAPLGLTPVDSDDFGGFTLSITIGLSAIALSLPLGVLLALGRRSDLLLISAVSTAYIEVIRGVPLIVWLFTAQLLLNYFLPPGTNFDLMLRVIIMSTLFAAAYIAEVVRGGLASLPKGQTEGAESLGLPYWSAMRLIILPQALKVSIPGIVNTFIGLFKDTTLVAFIGMFDPIGFASAIRADTDWQGIYWEIYIFIALVFFAFCFAMSRYSIWLERRLERSHR